RPHCRGCAWLSFSRINTAAPYARSWHESCFPCSASLTTSWRKAMNTGTTRNVMLGLAAVTVTLMAAGCAGERRTDIAPAYQQDLDRAAASISEAEREGATQHGGADLTRARDKLNSAQRLITEGDPVAGQRLAVEASLDADVAAATERNA